MKNHLSLFGLTLTLFAAAGCGGSTSEVITPDERFYAQGLAAEQNGIPPAPAAGSPGKGSMTPSGGPSALSP